MVALPLKNSELGRPPNQGTAKLTFENAEHSAKFVLQAILPQGTV